MPRVKRGVTARARHKKVLDLAKGYRGRRGNVFRVAKEAVMKAGQYAYRDRRTKKREFRALWITRINAAVREHGLSYSVFMNALKKVYKKQKQELPLLTDYAVRIPPGGKSDALCETIITWNANNKEFKTRGLDSDQTVSAIEATVKMLNLI